MSDMLIKAGWKHLATLRTMGESKASIAMLVIVINSCLPDAAGFWQKFAFVTNYLSSSSEHNCAVVSCAAGNRRSQGNRRQWEVLQSMSDTHQP